MSEDEHGDICPRLHVYRKIRIVVIIVIVTDFVKLCIRGSVKYAQVTDMNNAYSFY